MGSTLSNEGPPSAPHLLTAPAEPETWTQLEAEIPFLRRAARQWYPDHADADELVQDTLIRALSSAHLWGGGVDLSTWLLTLMRNQANTATNQLLAAD